MNSGHREKIAEFIKQLTGTDVVVFTLIDQNDEFCGFSMRLKRSLTDEIDVK